MHAISKHLPGHEHFFTQLFPDSRIGRAVRELGGFENTIMGYRLKARADAYLQEHGLQEDFQAERYGHSYDLVVCCTDMIVPERLASCRTVFVQEGMTDPITPWAKVINKLKLPGFMAFNTSLNGCGNVCDVYCAGSEGYRDYFVEMGTEAERVLVTGIINYDNCIAYRNNDFPHHGYVMVATSDIREMKGKDDREAFIRKCTEIAGGRRLLFKFHPNEDMARATAEVRKWAPSDALIFTEGNTEEMIANASELITQLSTVVYVGIALGIPVHSYFDLKELYARAPLQNGGTSACHIAEICEAFLAFEGNRRKFAGWFRQQQHIPVAA
jgi:hypothetical protein